MKYIRHVAGEYDHDTQLQVCVMCGALLLDFRDVIWVFDRPPGGWNEGVELFVSEDGRFKTVSPPFGNQIVSCDLHEVLQNE